MLGIILFTIASYLCANANDIQTLLLCRVVQATGACSTLVISRAIIRDTSEGLAAAKADDSHQAFSCSAAQQTMTAGAGVVVINGVACVADSNALSTEFIIGTCLKVGADFIEILVH